MNAPLFRLQGVTRCYGSRQVLNVDRLEIRQNEILALVGPSGAGKSTLLRLLNFLEPPTQGTIHFLGDEIGPDRQPSLDLRRRVTTIFQRPVLLRRTVYQNVRYGLQLRGWRDREDRIGQVLEQVGLADLAQAQARTLSGGEAQRVALARAMV
ncbi:MAG: ATP-binding cassette domain-containing protein, partial [Chloroflexi bacterium]|nr:ATP-binding cassette domain-containing protein [Chloroflexota bacterium]